MRRTTTKLFELTRARDFKHAQHGRHSYVAEVVGILIVEFVLASSRLLQQTGVVAGQGVALKEEFHPIRALRYASCLTQRGSMIGAKRIHRRHLVENCLFTYVGM